MKKKLIILTIISIISTFFIYNLTHNDDITIVSLGDGLSLGMTSYNIKGKSFNDYLKEEYANKHKLKKYIPDFAHQNQTIKELIYEIKENKALIINNKKIEIKQAIHEANILTIAIGLDELSKISITPQIRREFTEDLKELLSQIKALNNNKVFVISIYSTKDHDLLTTSKINAIIRDITLSNSFNFIDLSDIINESYFFNSNSYYINYEGHKKIYEKIKQVLN